MRQGGKGMERGCPPLQPTRGSGGAYIIFDMIGRARGPDRNAWRAGLCPAGHTLDTPGLEHGSGSRVVVLHGELVSEIGL